MEENLIFNSSKYKTYQSVNDFVRCKVCRDMGLKNPDIKEYSDILHEMILRLGNELPWAEVIFED